MKEQGTIISRLLKLLFNPGSFWYLIVLVVVVLTVLFFIFPLSYPLSFARYLFGSVFVLFLPGYSLVRLFFPLKLSIDSIERFAMSLGISLAVSPLVVLVLNFSSLGISPSAIVISLSVVITALATAALARDFELSRSGSKVDRPQ